MEVGTADLPSVTADSHDATVGAPVGPTTIDLPFNRFVADLPVGLFVMDAAGVAIYANDTARALLGQGIVPGSNVERLGEVYRAYRSGTDELYPVEQMPVARALGGESHTVSDMEIRHDGVITPIEVWATPVYDSDHRLEYALAVFQDISKRTRAEALLRDTEERFRSAFDNAPIGMALLAPEGSYLKVNAAMVQLTGYSESELLSRRFQDVTHPDDLQRDGELRQQLLDHSIDHYRIEKRYIRPDGSLVWTLMACSLVTDPVNGEMFIVQVEDIGARKQMEETLRHSSLHDPLTGLCNRLLFDDHLKSAQARSRRSRSLVGVGMIDLNGFKAVNDQFGHLAGDQILVTTAARLLATLRENDTVARFGGDEFAIVIETDMDCPQLDALAKRIALALSDPIQLAEGAEVRVSASVGLALGADDVTAHELLMQADRAMYSAKGRGGGYSVWRSK